MNAWRACVRLWVFGSTAWIGFWIWNYAGKCFISGNGLMWCPDVSGDVVMPTSWLRIGLMVLGGPLVLLAAGVALSRVARASGSNPGARQR